MEDYQAARDARERLTQSDQLVPTSVPGASGSGATMANLEDDDLREYVPAPRFKDWLIEKAAERRHYDDYDQEAAS